MTEDDGNVSEDKTAMDNKDAQIVILPRERKERVTFDPENILKKLNESLPGHDYAKAQLIMSLEKIQLTKNQPINTSREVILLYGNLGVGKYSLIKEIGRITKFPVIKLNLESFYYSHSNSDNPNALIVNLINALSECAHEPLDYSNVKPERLKRHIKIHNEELTGSEKLFEPIKNAEFSIVYFENTDTPLLCHTYEQSERNYAMKFQLELGNFLRSDLRFPQGGLTTRNMLYVLSGKLTKNNYIFSNENTVGFAPINRGNNQVSNDFKQISRKDLQEVGMNGSLSNCITKIIGLDNIKQEEFEASLKYKDSFLNTNLNLLKNAYNIDINFGDDSIKRIAAHLAQKKENYIGIKETIDVLLSPYYLAPNKFSNRRINIDKETIDRMLKQI